jgi:hypothetical protein
LSHSPGAPTQTNKGGRGRAKSHINGQLLHVSRLTLANYSLYKNVMRALFFDRKIMKFAGSPTKSIGTFITNARNQNFLRKRGTPRFFLQV